MSKLQFFYKKSKFCKNCFLIENRFFDWKIDFSIKKTGKKWKQTGKNNKIGVGGRREAPSIKYLNTTMPHSSPTRLLVRGLAVRWMTAYEIMPSLVGSEMCIRDRL